MLQTLLLVSALLVADNQGDDAAKARPLEGLAKAGVGAVISSILETPASVGGVQLDLKKQFLELSDVKIANPKKFTEGDAISVKKIRVEADPKLLFSEEPVIRLIQVSGGTVNAEQTVSHGMNLKKLLDSASRMKGSKPRKDGSKKKWRIEKAIIDDCTANITSELLTRNTTQKKLDHIEMNFMGQDNKGMTTDAAVSRVLETLIDKLGLFEGGGAAPLINLLGR